MRQCVWRTCTDGHGSSKGQGEKAKGPPGVTAMTYLSDKECARVDNIQEVPEAAIEGCLEKGVGEKRR